MTQPALAALAVGIVAAAAWAEGERRVVLAAAGLALAGWWWGSARLTALDSRGLRHPGYARARTLLNARFRKATLAQRAAILEAADWLIMLIDRSTILL